MSHASYFFLVDLDLSFDEGTAMEQAEDRFLSYADSFCDENNWWMIEGVVTNDHRIFGSINHNGPGNAWDITWDQAARALASEFQVDIDPEFTLGDKSHKAIIGWFNEKVPAYLASMYQSATGIHPANGFCIDRYTRAQLSRIYELYQQSVDCDRVPFTPHLAEPYDYRAFDLTGGRKSECDRFGRYSHLRLDPCSLAARFFRRGRAKADKHTSFAASPALRFPRMKTLIVPCGRHAANACQTWPRQLIVLKTSKPTHPLGASAPDGA